MGGKFKILCVEDDQDYFLFLKLMVDEYSTDNVEMELATTAGEGIDKLASNRYDLCLLDYRLEEQTGLDVLRAFKDRNIDTAFVFLTSHSKKEIAFEALRLGAMDFLTKSKFDRFEFEKTLSYAIYKKKNELKFEKLATRDSLTGLGNRNLFDEQLKSALMQSERNGERFGLIYIDIDGFKPVNDTYGHDAGDRVLQELGRRIGEQTRKSDISARLGGDEFAIILMRVEDIAVVDRLARKIELSISSRPYDIENGQVSVGASIGIATYPDDGTDIDGLLRLADKRMYECKRGKKGISKFAFA